MSSFVFMWLTEVGVVDTCGDLCKVLADKVGNQFVGAVCTLLCDAVGIKEFVTIIDKCVFKPLRTRFIV